MNLSLVILSLFIILSSAMLADSGEEDSNLLNSLNFNYINYF